MHEKNSVNTATEQLSGKLPPHEPQNDITPDWLEDKVVNEVLFCEEFISKHNVRCIPTLQEWLGYLLIPSTKAQRMLMMIGNGGEGKSRIGVLLKNIFGSSMSTGNLQLLETNCFARAALENAYLFLDDDIMMDKITDTNVLKTIITNEGKILIERKPLSRKTVVHHLSFISSVFSYAIKMDMLSDNPCRRVTVPKSEQKEKEIYTLEEVEQIFSALESEPLKYRLFIVLAIYSGFRRGEMLGLEWKDIDWENNVISVRRTSNYSAKRGIYTDTTKTKKSQRSIKFPQLIMELLKAYEAEQNEERSKYGDKWIETDRIFIKHDGSPMNNNTPYFWFGEFCEKNNFRFCDIHSLRHLHASLLINAGVDMVSVSGDLGHSCVATTSNIYCHMFQEAKARNCDAITNALSFGNKKEPQAS